jgi:dimethylargininase
MRGATDAGIAVWRARRQPLGSRQRRSGGSRVKVFKFTDAIVRTPGNSVVRGLRSGNGPAPSLTAFRAEHDSYVKALQDAGVEVEVLPPLENLPDSVFVEDAALVFADCAIVLRPGAASRAGEGRHAEAVLRRRFERLAALAEGTADGGDVLVTPGMVFIGLSARTDAIGARSLARLLAELGREARIVAAPPGILHLKSAAALVDEETIIATPALAASGMFADFRVLTTPEGEESGANMVRVNDVVLAGAEYRRTLDLVGALGLNVVPLSVTEIGKLDAGLSCMSLRW